MSRRARADGGEHRGLRQPHGNGGPPGDDLGDRRPAGAAGRRVEAVPPAQVASTGLSRARLRPAPGLTARGPKTTAVRRALRTPSATNVPTIWRTLSGGVAI